MVGGGTDPRHIVFEGIDGSGKMTQSKLLSEALGRAGAHASVYSYPDYKSEYGRIILEDFLYGKRKFLVEELLMLYLADISKDKQRVLGDLAGGNTVIMDRYFLSTVAYQTSGGFDYDSAREVVGQLELPVPNVIFYIDVQPELSFERKNKQKSNNPDKFEKDKLYLNKVRGIYERMMSDKYPEGSRWVKIDGRKGIDEIHQIVVKELGL
ncbi:MAG: dTMP kinase [Candidatus Micrarchaeota archaeon]|nr:dTMP kinase [Candidatus Micrarchaeota archaeon]